MSSSQSIVLFSVIVLVTVISDIYCGDGLVSATRQAAPISPIGNENPWQKLPNQNPINPSFGNPNQQSTTTPWPALGGRRNYQRPENNANSSPNPGQTGQNYAQAANRNIGVDLSYGLNPSHNSKPNQNAFNSANRNVGVDLSYGLNPGGRPVVQNQVNKFQTPAAGSSLPQGGGSKPNQKPPAQRPVPAGPNQNIPVPGPAPETDGKQQQQQKPKPGEKLSEDDELREFSEALLKKDANNAAKYVTVNYQGKTTSRSETDEAPEPLLTVNAEALEISTIARMLLLHNNYILETNANEYVTPQEKSEENSFLDAVLATPLMQYTRNFLVEKGKISKDPKDFRDKLKEIWFNMYSRGGGKIGSSGFEHVFLAELKGNDVSGLHNWLYFNEAESKKQANYLGYLKKLEFGNKGAIVKHHFQLAGKDKPVGSMFIGTSPEFELALYSTCFILRADKVCPLRLGGNNFIIRTFTFRYRGKKMIGSAFPEI